MSSGSRWIDTAAMARSLPLISLILTLLGSLLWLERTVQHREGEVSRLEGEVAMLRQEVEALRRASERAEGSEQMESPPVAVLPPDPAVPTAAPPQGGVNAAEDSAAHRGVWRARQFVSEVEEDLALTPEQRDVLAQAYEDELGAIASASVEARDAILARVVGAESAALYRERRNAAAERAREERLANEVIVLGRKVSLTPEQEGQARAALARIEQMTRPRTLEIEGVMREAMANHLGGPEARGDLVRQYDQIRALQAEVKAATDQALFEELAPVLTDDQKNALLALQAGRQ